jgi:poly(3-hydroxyalkanoate) synthetase
MRNLVDYDPAPTLAEVKCPILALNGSKDGQVPPGQSLPAIRQATKGNRDVTIVELPNLNHLFPDGEDRRAWRVRRHRGDRRARSARDHQATGSWRTRSDSAASEKRGRRVIPDRRLLRYRSRRNWRFEGSG